jgi:methyl-accepting chemotaxis protein
MTQSLGSSDEAVKTSLIRFGQLQRTSEATDAEIANLGQQFFGVAAQLRSTNPALGDVDQIMDRMFRTIATGGPRLATLGIDLEKADIEARALEMSGKGAGESLSFAELQAAGISLAFEQLSPNMTSITDGMGNVLIVSERLQERWGDLKEELGATFAESFLKSLEDGAGSIEEFTRSLSPFIEEVGTGLGQTLGLLSEFADLLNQVLPQLVPDQGGDTFGATGESAEEASRQIDLFKGSGEAALEVLRLLRNNTLFQAFALAVFRVNIADTTEETNAMGESVGAAARAMAEAETQELRMIAQTVKLAAAIRTTSQTALEFYNQAVENIPSVTKAFQELSDEVGTDQILESLDRSLLGTQQWVQSIGDQLSAGNENVAALMSQIGADKSRNL